MLVADDIGAVGALSVSLLLRWEPKAVFAIWNVFMDESGMHGSAPITLLGGWLSTVEEWRQFEKEWREILQKRHVEYFHSVEIVHRSGQFQGWCDEQVNEFVEDVRGAINRNLSASFVGILRDDDYRAFYKDGNQSNRIATDSKCGVLFRAIASFVPHLLGSSDGRAPDGHKVYFVFESGNKNAGNLLEVFNRFKALPTEWSNLFGTMTSGAKKEFPGLQVTDMVVSATYQQELAEHGKPPSIIESSSLAGTASPADEERPCFRIPLSRAILADLKNDLLLGKENRRKFADGLLEQSRVRRSSLRPSSSGEEEPS